MFKDHEFDPVTPEEEARRRQEEMGIRDRISALHEYFAEEGIDPRNAIYMGDDIPDLECMREVGIPVCPADAAAEVIEASRYVSEFKGGEGAVRDIVEQVLLSLIHI